MSTETRNSYVENAFLGDKVRDLDDHEKLVGQLMQFCIQAKHRSF